MVLVLEKPLRPVLLLDSVLDDTGWIMGGMSHGLYDSWTGIVFPSSAEEWAMVLVLLLVSVATASNEPSTLSGREAALACSVCGIPLARDAVLSIVPVGFSVWLCICG